jgi:hemoglobin
MQAWISTNAEFNALVCDLITTLNKFTVDRLEQSELLSVLSPMRQDTVERR